MWKLERNKKLIKMGAGGVMKTEGRMVEVNAGREMRGREEGWKGEEEQNEINPTDHKALSYIIVAQ